MYVCVYPVPKFRSCHKAIMVITGRAHCIHLYVYICICMYIYIIRLIRFKILKIFHIYFVNFN